MDSSIVCDIILIMTTTIILITITIPAMWHFLILIIMFNCLRIRIVDFVWMVSLVCDSHYTAAKPTMYINHLVKTFPVFPLPLFCHASCCFIIVWMLDTNIIELSIWFLLDLSICFLPLISFC